MPRSNPRPSRPNPRGSSPPASRDPKGSPASAELQSPWVRLRSVTTHPLIFQRMVGQVDPAAQAGQIVNVYDRAGALLGRGLFNPKSQIVVRMMARGDLPINDAFWRQRLATAVELRRRLRLDEVTDAYRLVHAEGDGLSGLVAERYGDWLVFEVFSLGIFQRIEMFGRMLGELLGPSARLDRPSPAPQAWHVHVRADEQIQRIEGFSVRRDETDASVVIREHGIRYRVDVAGGHKTGFFCDQRDNRLRFAGLCRDADVLDLCCYTGGFGLAARKIGLAREVTSVDLDEAALELAKENANLNNARLSLVHCDAFIYARQMIANGRTFHAVVLDPPKFATSREKLPEALRKYHDLNGLAMQTVRPGGILLTCSCSGLVSPAEFLQTVMRAARPARRRLQLLGMSGAGPDHPVMDDCPESAYLKAVWLRVL